MLLICPVLFYFAVLGVSAQENALAQPAVGAPKAANPDYPDNVRGLERLAKDIMNAQKEGQQSRAQELAANMVLPDAQAWYLQTFGPDIANDEGAKYAADKNLSGEILKFFFGAIQGHFTDVTAARFGDSCDDNAGETAFGTLQLRLEPTPLYELRLQNGNQFLRLFAIVYVDGGFRFTLAPRVPDHFPFVIPKGENMTVKILRSDEPDNGIKPVRVGGNVQAARLLHRVQPLYPDVARNERLQGTVRLHAIIGKDGAISRLVVLCGYCSLAKSSVQAVSQWRYSPTLLLGQPVEVDTTIDVIFALNH